MDKKEIASVDKKLAYFAFLLAIVCAIVGAPEYLAVLGVAALGLFLLWLFVRYPELIAAAIVIAAIVAIILAL